MVRFTDSGGESKYYCELIDNLNLIAPSKTSLLLVAFALHDEVIALLVVLVVVVMVLVVLVVVVVGEEDQEGEDGGTSETILDDAKLKSSTFINLIKKIQIFNVLHVCSPKPHLYRRKGIRVTLLF